MPGPTLFRFIGDSIDTALATYVTTVSSSVATTFISVAIGFTSLYYVMLAYMIMLGRVESPWSNFMLSAGKFALIGSFAVSASTYGTWIVESIRGLETGLTAAFSGANGINTTSVYQVVDDSIGKGWGVSADLWEKAGNRGWTEIGMAIGEYINAIIIALATIIIAIPAGAMIVVAKTVLSIMLGIGPLFIMLLMWPLTKQFFDRWFGVVMTALFQIALLAAVLSFAMMAFTAYVDPVDLESDQNILFISLQLTVIAVVMSYILASVNSYASQLGGGVATASITFGQFVRGAINPISSVARTINAPSTRRDMQSGMMVTGGRLNHLAAGNTMWNPAYRQHVIQNMGKNWGRARGGKASEIK